MNAMNRIARALPILVVGALALTGCDLDLTDPNNPSEDDVLGSISGILQVAVGLQAEYGNEQVDPVYVAALASVGHYLLLVKADLRDPLFYLAILLLLMLVRLPPVARQLSGLRTAARSAR